MEFAEERSRVIERALPDRPPREGSIGEGSHGGGGPPRSGLVGGDLSGSERANVEASPDEGLGGVRVGYARCLKPGMDKWAARTAFSE